MDTTRVVDANQKEYALKTSRGIIQRRPNYANSTLVAFQPAVIIRIFIAEACVAGKTTEFLVSFSKIS